MLGDEDGPAVLDIGPEGQMVYSVAQAQGLDLAQSSTKQSIFFKPKQDEGSVDPKATASSKPKKERNHDWLIALAVAAVGIVITYFLHLSLVIVAIVGIFAYFVSFFLLLGMRATIIKQQERRRLMSELLLEQKPRPAKAVRVQQKQQPKERKAKEAGPAGQPGAKPASPLASYIKRVLETHKNLEVDLVSSGIKKTPAEFIKSMMLYSIFMGAGIGFVFGILLIKLGMSPVLGILLSACIAFVMYMMLFNRFLLYAKQRNKVVGKLVERDILFAARDVVIGMRSGMPLFNAMTSVSTSYGEAGKQFGKIIELVQLGLPIEEAMQEVSEKSDSPTFKRLMLQASVSIKAGVDVTSAIQDVVDDVMADRIIDLRRYGQKLNALAMFYMLFGVIFPSMGIAVATIMSTFINIFPVTVVVLVLGLVFIAFIQLLMLNIMRSSRPVFAM